MRKARQQGFTLIELSIVLVIIGLIVGGVLVGQDLIKASEERAVIKEKTAIDTSIWAFRDKYGALPGDMANATSIWGSASAAQCTYGVTPLSGTPTCNGDGDGQLDNSQSNSLKVSNPNYSYSNQLEHLWLWHHLSNAGMWPGLTAFGRGDYTGMGPNYIGVPGNNIPTSALSGAGWNAWGAWNALTIGTPCYPGVSGYWGSCWGGNVLLLNSGVFDYQNYPAGQPLPIPSGVLAPQRAKAIDTKMDDGYPDTGAVRGSTEGQAANSATGCANNLGTRFDYNSSSAAVQCSLLFIEGW